MKMTFADNKNALEQVELPSPVHYFGVVDTATAAGPVAAPVMDPTYGLVDGRFADHFPEAPEPVDADNAQVVVGVIDAEPVLTVIFNHESPDDETPEANAIIQLHEAPSESDINPVIRDPRHAGAIIREAAAYKGLELVHTTPDNVVGLEGYDLDAPQFLARAGFKGGGDEVVQLVPMPFSAARPDPEPIAA